MDDDRLEEFLRSDYLGELTEHPITDIRRMRSECQELEGGLSFVRRMVQGRLDIVGAELARRQAGGSPSDVADMVARLPETLADKVRSPGNGRLPQSMAPADMTGHLAQLDTIAPVDKLTALAALSDEQVSDLADELAEYETTVSLSRRALHDQIDALQAELTRRYKSGEATVESLLS